MAHVPPEVVERAAQLRREIERHNRLYYVEAKSEISDPEFDALLRELIEIEKAHPELLTPDSPTQRVGGAPLGGFAVVTHAIPMLSIENRESRKEVDAFHASVLKKTGDAALTYLAEPKMDGLAVSLRYEKGILVLGATRGDGRQGDDITANIRTIRNVPLRLACDNPPDVVEARGEVYWPRPAFEAFNRKLLESGEEPFANPRNGAAGTLKQLDSRIVAIRGLAFMAHGFGEISQPVAETASGVMDFLKAGGLPVNPHTRVCKTFDEAWAAIQEWDIQRRKANYDTDGMVVKVNELALRDKLGATPKYPRWCFAYKYPPEQAPAVLKSVTFQVGRTGVITPVAHFDPVRLAGTNVSNANLHNFDEIRRLDIHLGDTVLVQKAGEIIPQVVGVLKDKRPPGAQPIQPPTHCPECQTALEWDPPREGQTVFWCVNPVCEFYLQRRQRRTPPSACRTKTGRGCDSPVEPQDHMVDLRCCNPDCPAQIREHILHFAGRDQMDIENLGPVLVEKLLAQGLVKRLADLYRLKETDLRQLERMGELSARNVVEAIQKSKTRGLARVLAGLGIPKVGATLARDLASQFPSIESLIAASEADIRRALTRADKNAERAAVKAWEWLHSQEGRQAMLPIFSNMPLAEQIRQAGVPGLSAARTIEKSLPALEERFDTLADIAAASVEELAECLHEEGVVSNGVHDFFHHRGGRQLVESLREVGVDMTQAPAAPAGPQPLANKNLVVTGTLKGYSRSQIEERIRSLGGRAGSSVTSKTHYLVAGDNAGSKLDKARELNIPVLSEEQFNELIARPPSSDR